MVNAKKGRIKRRGHLEISLIILHSLARICNFYQIDTHHITPILNQINFNINS
jgi:hypothetical protein